MGVLDAREPIDTEAAIVIGARNQCSFLIGVYRVYVSAISTEGEDTHYFPAELAGAGCPDAGVRQRGGAALDLLLVSYVVELLAISLINGSEITRVFRPVHGSNC